MINLIQFFVIKVRGFIMEQLVAENVYRRVHMYDYQGVCFMGEKQDNSRSNYLLNVSIIAYQLQMSMIKVPTL